MIEKSKVCCFSGHRKLPADKLPAIEQALTVQLREMIAAGVCFFGSGMALGFDMLAARCVLALKEENPHIALIAVLPCPSEQQTKFWNDEQRREYYSLLEQTDKVRVCSEHYHSGCMQERNRRLVQGSEYCVCYLTEKTGGTAMTVELARKAGLEVINIAEKI